MIQIHILKNNQLINKITITPQKKYIIGRGINADIRVNDNTLSRKHMSITLKNNKLCVLDNNSSNGIYFQNKQISEIILNPGQDVQAGNITIQFIETKDVDIASTPASETIKQGKITNYNALLEIARFIFSINDKKKLSQYISKLFSNQKECITILILVDSSTNTLYDPVSKSTCFDPLVKFACSKATKNLAPIFLSSPALIPQKECKNRPIPSSLIVIPLFVKNRLVGTIYSETPPAVKPFTQNDLDFMHTVMEMASMVIGTLELESTICQEIKHRKVMEKYISPDIINDIMGDKSNNDLGGKKALTTIMFSDIRGFTKMSENMNAENVVRLLNHYFSAMTDIIFENSGTLDKFIGDEIMSIYGVPVFTEKHAENAVLTAMKMIKATKDMKTFLLRNMLPVFDIGIGINSGEVIAGNIGSSKKMEFTVIGDTVNTASRLVSAAKPGEIIINETTYELTKNSFKFEHLEPIEVKGKSKKLNIFKVIDIK